MARGTRWFVLVTMFAFGMGLWTSTAGAQGLALFEQKCIMCHGAEGAGGFAHRSIKGASASRIQRGINMRPDMAFLSYLSTADINSIAAYLATVPPGQKLPRNGDPVAGQPIFRTACTYCHTIGRGARVDL